MNREQKDTIVQHIIAFTVPACLYFFETVKPETKVDHRIEIIILSITAWLLYKFGPRIEKLQGLIMRNPAHYVIGIGIQQAMLFAGTINAGKTQEIIMTNVFVGIWTYYSLVTWDQPKTENKKKKSVSESLKKLCQKMVDIHPNSLPIKT